MSSEMELFRLGVAALQAGNRENAVQLLSQVVDVNPFNEQAWFYLAAAENDPFMRKRYLERVLELNPSNIKAQDAFIKVEAKLKQPKATKQPPQVSHAPVVDTPTPNNVFSDAPPRQQYANDTTHKSMPPVYVPEALSAQDAASAAGIDLSWLDAPVTEDEPVSSPAQSAGFSQVADIPDDELPDISDFKSTKKSASKAEVLDDLRGEVDPSARNQAKKSKKVKSLQVLSDDAGSLLGAAKGESGFALPLDIPGAPARVNPQSLISGGLKLLRGSLRILTRRGDAYAREIERATWWRFVLYVLFTAFISAIFLTVIMFINALRLRELTGDFNIFTPIVAFVLGIPFYASSLVIGGGISYFLIGRFSVTGRPKFLKHLYMIASAWLPLSLLASLLAAVWTILRFDALAIVSMAAICVFAAWIIRDGVKALYSIPDVQGERIAVGSVIGGILIGRLILGVVFGAILAANVLIFVVS